ncbi:MAG: hypothetical protein JSW52_12005 [Candidatus Coatesbacteria bacterium]|nr:MAG: hypothetical protein JSW52_12005 [Candidatus Coatesbacteria bacterium]
MRYRFAFVIALFVQWVIPNARAVELPNLPLEIIGEVSPYYYLNLTEEQKEVKGRPTTETERKYRNSFGLGAAYLGFKLDVTDDLYAELVLSDYGSNYIRYAYAGFANLIPRHELYIGLVKTPWVYYEDELWGWRFVKSVGVEDHNFIDEEKFGAGIAGDVFPDYLTHHFSFTDGDIYGRGKAAEYRLSVFPLASFGFLGGFSINGLLHCGNLFGDTETEYWSRGDEDITFGPFKANTYGALIGFDHRYLTLGTGYFERVEGDVFDDWSGKRPYQRDVVSYLFTGHATAHVFPWFDVLGRFDFVEPDTGSRDWWKTENYDETYDKYLYCIVGAAFTFAGGHFKIVPNYQTRIPEKEVNIGYDPDGNGYHSVFVPTRHYFYVNMNARF